MPDRSLNDVIQLYTTGVISRESLEREIGGWDIGATEPSKALGDSHEECVTLYPDDHGVWRAFS